MSREKDTNPHVEALVRAWRIGIADEVARVFDATPMRTEDRLNDDYLKRTIRETVIAVLTKGLPREWFTTDHPVEPTDAEIDAAVKAYWTVAFDRAKTQDTSDKAMHDSMRAALIAARGQQ